MRVLVIGGAGFIGPHVVRQLAEGGHRVAVFHSGAHEPGLPPQVEHIHCQPTPSPPALSDQLPAFASQFRHFAPDVVLHMLAMTKADCRTAVETFAGAAARLVVVSSADVYRAYGRLNRSEPGPPDAVLLVEDSPLRQKLYPYRGLSPRKADDPLRWLDDYDKLLVEKAAMASADLPATVLRLPMVYGPGDQQRRLTPYLRLMDLGRRAILLAEEDAAWRGSRTYVDCAAAAITLSITSDAARGRIYHVAEPDALTEAEWVRQVGAAAGWSGAVLSAPRQELPRHLLRPTDSRQHLVLDSGRIRQELGYREPVSRDQALQRAVAWERANPLPSRPGQDRADPEEEAVIDRLLDRHQR